MKRADGTMLEFICLLALALCAGTTAAKVDSQQLKLFYDRVQNQRDVVRSGGLSADQQILLSMLVFYDQSPAPEPQRELPSLDHQAFKANTTYLLMSDTSYGWLSDAWFGDECRTYQYNAQNKDTNRVTQDWNQIKADWVNYMRKVSTYNESDSLSTEILQLWDTLSVAWANSSMMAYTYDGSGRQSTLLYQEWEAGDWVNGILITNTYDGEGRLSVWVYQDWKAGTPGVWINNHEDVITYNADSHVDNIVFQDWDTLAIDWVNNYKFSYTYDLGGNMTEWLRQTWQDDQWVNSLRTISTFVGNLETESIDQRWDLRTAGWGSSYKSTYTYDISGNLTMKLLEALYYTGWVPNKKDEYLYDANGNRIREENLTWVDPNWVNVSKSVWVYDAALAMPISHENIPRAFHLAQNYPNPFNPTTSINFSIERLSQVEISVYNLLGEKIRTIENGQFGPGVYQTFWDGVDYAGHRVGSGIYFSRLEANDFLECRKMILLK